MIVLTTHLICVVAYTVSYKQTKHFVRAEGMRSPVISSTVEYTRIQFSALDKFGQRDDPGDQSVLTKLISARVYYTPPLKEIPDLRSISTSYTSQLTWL